MLSVAELVRDLAEKGLIKDKYPHKKWIRLTTEEMEHVRAVGRALKLSDAQVLRSILLRGMMQK